MKKKKDITHALLHLKFMKNLNQLDLEQYTKSTPSDLIVVLVHFLFFFFFFNLSWAEINLSKYS